MPLNPLLNPACGDEHIGFFSFFLGPFPNLEKTVGSVIAVHFSRELLVNLIFFSTKIVCPSTDHAAGRERLFFFFKLKLKLLPSKYLAGQNQFFPGIFHQF